MKLKINIEAQKESTSITKDNFLEKDGVTLNLKEILFQITKNEDHCIKVKIFSNIPKIKVSKRISQITLSKEKLKEYF